MAKSKKNNQIKIYYDGNCPMCNNFISKVRDSEKQEQFSFHNSQIELPEKITKEQVDKEIHVIDSSGNLYKNAEGIIKIFEQYPRFKAISIISKLPFIKKVLSLGYKFIAGNRYFLFGESKNIYWLKNIIALALITGLLVSPALWFGERFFPHIPIFTDKLTIPVTAEIIIALGLIVSLFLTIFCSKPRKFIIISITLALLLAIFDQMRWQPWFFQYIIMLVFLGSYDWDFKNTLAQKLIMNASRFLIISIYFFSGLQKLNNQFLNEVLPWLIQPLTKSLPQISTFDNYHPSLLIPILEIAISIGLLSKKFRKVSVIIAISMHISILILLSPLGHNWNTVVWPWNIAMILITYILFYNKDFDIFSFISSKSRAGIKILCGLLIILPSLNFLNLWDSYLSWSLYSGNNSAATLYISQTMRENLPSHIQPYIHKSEGESYSVNIFNWAFQELNVPPYPEPRIYKRLAKQLCSYSTNEDDLRIVIQHKDTVFKKGRLSEYNCNTL